MRRLVLLVAIGSAAASLGACGAPPVHVVARLVNQNPSGGASDTVSLSDLPVMLVPFDRDQVFDSLAKAYSQPEPQIPDSLVKLQGEIAQAQQASQDAEQAWQDARDSLQTISKKMQAMNRASAEYRVLFNDFDNLDQREKTARRAMDQAFREFTDLQSRFTAQSQEIKAKREAWADEAFAAVDSVMAARADEMGRDLLADTTDAQGTARLHPKKGQWWVYARYELPYNELYWNVPVEVKGGDPITVLLNRENAKVRPKL